jgi:pyruvate,water dikinase
MSDFKTNEYADLIGGELYEPDEENPMLGFRGASRYYSEQYRPGFALECQALKQVRETLGLRNVVVMIPFCRTLEEADKVLEVMAQNGLERGDNGLEVYVMIEIPSNIILAAEFAERFDGFSIGSNDLTQLTLGVDRDSARLADIFDERNEAVKRTIADLIDRAHAADTYVGICGQAPSDYPEFAAFLVRAGIDSMSLNPDSVIEVKKRIANVEQSQD